MILEARGARHRPSPRRHGTQTTALGALFLTGLVLGAAPAAAALFTLSEGQRREAIRLGQGSVTRDSLGEEWTIQAGAVEVTVMTPFHRLALLARQTAFRQQDLRTRDIERVERENGGRLALRAAVRGDRPDFARFLAPALRVGMSEVRPVFVQNERTALRQADGRYLARCAYAFPTTGLDPRGRVMLVIRDSGGTEVARVPIDLAAFR